MVRTAKIDREEVKRQLLKGISPEAIATYQGCTRQYVSLIKGDLVKEGKMQAVVGGRKAEVSTTKVPRSKVPIETIPPVEVEMEPVSMGWDDKEQSLYRMMQQARIAQKLAVENQDLKDRNEELEAENKRIHKAIRYKQQWDQATNQGNKNPPIGEAK